GASSHVTTSKKRTDDLGSSASPTDGPSVAISRTVKAAHGSAASHASSPALSARVAPSAAVAVGGAGSSLRALVRPTAVIATSAGDAAELGARAQLIRTHGGLALGRQHAAGRSAVERAAHPVGADEHADRRLVAGRRSAAEALRRIDRDLDDRIAGIAACAHPLEVVQLGVAAELHEVVEASREELRRAVDVPGGEIEQAPAFEVVEH